MADNRRLFQVSSEQREELGRWAQSRALPAGEVFRARLVLAVADGTQLSGDRAETGRQCADCGEVEESFRAGRQATHGHSGGTGPNHPASAANAVRRQYALVLPQTGRGVADQQVHGAWPATIRNSSLKAVDIIGLYLNPPQHAAVFCVDEKTAIGAGSAGSGTAALSGPNRAARLRILPPWHAVAVCGAQGEDRPSGKQDGQTSRQRRFHRVSRGVDRQDQVGARDSHCARQSFRAQDPGGRRVLRRVPEGRFHFTPTYFSWLNQVGLWFAKIERDVIARGGFTSVADLRRK